jgi:hypothetical protein
VTSVALIETVKKRAVMPLATPESSFRFPRFPLALSLAAGLGLAGLGLAQAAEVKERQVDPAASPVEHSEDVFGPDPSYEDKPYDPNAQYEIYGAKRPVEAVRPLLELWRPIYTEGPFEPGINVIGERNLLFPALAVFGDVKSAVEYSDLGANEVGALAIEANINVDLKLTGTERIHGFFKPLKRGGSTTSYEFFGDDTDQGDTAFNLNPEALFFEGDLGQISSGLLDRDTGFDMPISFGLMPLVFQNGIWVEEAFTGAAFSIPSLNSPTFDISNMDVTVFAGFDDVENPGILNNDGGRNTEDLDVYGITTFIEAQEGYFELGFGHVNGSGDFDDQSFSSLTGAFSRRYGGWLSNSVRAFYTFGQDRDNNVDQTADGLAILVENSFITSKPSTYVPYFNVFAGFDKPQPLSDQTGLLKNTGLTFENVGITTFPKLDDSANDTFGGAIGFQYLFNLDQQIVVEASTVQTIGGFKANGRNAKDDQYGLGLRYQLPIAPAWILRADGMVGFLDNDDDLAGARLEIRRKF